MKTAISALIIFEGHRRHSDSSVLINPIEIVNKWKQESRNVLNAWDKALKDIEYGLMADRSPRSSSRLERIHLVVRPHIHRKHARNHILRYQAMANGMERF